MPLRTDFSYQQPVDAAAGLSNVLGNLQGQLSDYEKQKFAEQRQNDLLKQQAIANERELERLNLAKAADIRSQEQLGDTQAEAARRAFTESTIAPIIATASENKSKAREMLQEASKAGGFTPTVQEQVALSKLLETPEVKTDYSKPSMYKYDPTKDTVVSYTPRSAEEEKQFLGQGFKYGSFDRPRKDSSDKDKDVGLFGVSPQAAALPEMIGSSDAPKATAVAQKMQDQLGLKVPEIDSILKQSIGTNWYSLGLDSKLQQDKLGEVLDAAGLVANVFVENKKGERTRVTPDEMAKGLMNPDIVIRTNRDGSRVLVNLKDEMKHNKKSSNLPVSKEVSNTILTNPNALSAL